MDWARDSGGKIRNGHMHRIMLRNIVEGGHLEQYDKKINFPGMLSERIELSKDLVKW
jgi:hypothetical protein